MEYDDNKDRILVDEAIAILETCKIEVELGKTNLPFVEWFSHFVSGELVDFGDTKGKGIVISHAPKENLDESLFAYKGDAQNSNSGGILLTGGLLQNLLRLNH